MVRLCGICIESGMLIQTPASQCFETYQTLNRCFVGEILNNVARLTILTSTNADEGFYASIRKNIQAPGFSTRPAAIHLRAAAARTHRLRSYQCLSRDKVLVAEARNKLTGIYRFTSIARPIDPAYLTNRALLIVLPVAAMLSAGLASFHDMGVVPLSAAFSGALAAFAAWALTRELAPDYNGAAFVALALAWLLNVAFGVRLVLLLFVALLLVRMVNRSTGLPSRPLDTLGVFGLCAWAATSTQQPLILLVASVAFVLDAVLEDPLRRHYLAAAACLPVFILLLPGNADLIAGDLTVGDWSLIGVISLGIILVVNTNLAPVSYCDTSPKRLNRVRVNAGLIVGWLLAVQTLMTNGRSAWLETPIWACMIAVLLSFVVRQAKRRPNSMIVG